MLISIDDYTIHKKINTNPDIDIYRAARNQDQLPVIIKYIPLSEYSEQQILNLKREFEIMQSIQHDSIVQVYELVKNQDGCLIAMEDGGISLKDYFAQKEKLSLEDFLTIAIDLTSIIQVLHKNRIVHKDIKPSNFVVQETSEGKPKIKVIDFGISTRLSREETGWKSLEVLEGSLQYISPEQTGRVNLSIDYRSDFYSLGITFYELLVGNPPFVDDDPLAMIHSHIAKNPEDIQSIRSDIPIEISLILKKLYEKNPENRYQSAKGLLHDLEWCKNNLASLGKTSFVPARQDYSDVFKIPQKLYGRNEETNTLISIFQKIVENQSSYTDAPLLLVSGYSGIGKTSFINETHKPITEANGYFIKGKFDQFQRDIPLSGIVQAFRELVNFMLAESSERLKNWEKNIQSALGDNGQVIIDIIPELEHIIGKQKSVSELAPLENQNRFYITFKNFISVFTKKEHPLVLFIDDLQWADTSSLNFLKEITTEIESKYLLVIGAYRSNEVDSVHPLFVMVDEINKSERKVQSIHLSPLEKVHINELVSDTLHTKDKAQLESFVELLNFKTGGNPFFLVEYLKTLYKESIIEFDHNKNQWTWEFEKVKSYKITDNVVDLMVRNLKKLPEKTISSISLSACIGAKFSLDILSKVSGHSHEELNQILMPAFIEGMLIPIGKEQSNQIRFQHDRVQQAAYSFIPENEQKSLHLKIARLLLSNVKGELSDRIFDIVNQYNQGLELITDPYEKLRLANLNLDAGQKAQNSLAYFMASKLYQNGISLLSKDSWTKEYSLTFALYKGYAESEYLSGNLKNANQLYPKILEKAQNTLDKMKIFYIQIQQFHIEGKYSEALKIISDALNVFDITIPESIEDQQILFQTELGHVAQLLETKNVDDLQNAPKLESEELISLLEILSIYSTTAYLANQMLLFIYASAKMTSISLEHGLSHLSSISYSYYSIICISMLGNFELGYKFGKLSIALSDQFDDLVMRSRVYFLFASSIHYWFVPYKDCIPFYEISTKAGFSGGEIEYANTALVRIVLSEYLMGIPLNQELDRINKYKNSVQKSTVFLYDTFFHPLLIQCLKNLLGQTNHESSLDDQSFSESTFLEKHKFPEIGYIYFNYSKVMSLYRFGYYQEAKPFVDIAEQVMLFLGISLGSDEYAFYVALTAIALYEIGNEEEKERYLKLFESQLARFEIWSSHCESNFLHKKYILQAEKSRVFKQFHEAMDFYEKSIQSSKQYGHLNNESLANELFAKFWIGEGKTQIASLYMTEAYKVYMKWGAVGKLKQLDEKYSAYISKKRSIKQDSSDATIYTKTNLQNFTHSSGSYSNELDLNSILKASQAIATEIEYNKLLKTLIKILIENAGAERVVLITQNEKDELWVEAEGTIDTKIVYSNPILLSDASDTLSESIVQYTIRSKSNLVLDNASIDLKFSSDTYVQTNKIRSVLCTPIVNKGRISTVLYLENNLTSGAFTHERVGTLNALATQAAVSIENASLYSSLEEKVEERTHELKQLNEISRHISESSNLDFILGQVLDFVEEQFHFNLISLYLLDDKKEFLLSYKNRFPSDFKEEAKEFFKNLKIPLTKAGGIHSELYYKKNRYYAPKLKDGLSQLDKSIIEIAHIKSIFIIPIIVQTQVIGFIDFSQYDTHFELNLEDIQKIERFCQQIAGAIHTSSLFQQVQLERAKSDKLLLNILPSKIADELKEKGSVKPVTFPSASILFTDFKGFTKIAEKILPEKLVSILDSIFLEFDRITSKHKVEKLKTIGDSYMCASGIPEESQTHPIDICLAALEIANFMRLTKQEKEKANESFWDMRIGIHSGPVVAGVVGQNKFSYDIWGDTVNTASRMESSGEPDRINISEATYFLVKDYFECEYRGKVQAKNKGDITMYFLNRLKKEYSIDKDGIFPNEKLLKY